jgi:hypothetical protein
MGAESVPVVAGDTTFYVEVAEHRGVGTVGLDDVLSFEGVRDTVTAISDELRQAFERAKPQEAVITFGLKLSVKSGKLTGLLVEGGGEASLAVTLTWKRSVESGTST